LAPIPHKSIDKSFGVEERKSDHFVHLSSELLLYLFLPPYPTLVCTSFHQAVEAGWFFFLSYFIGEPRFKHDKYSHESLTDFEAGRPDLSLA
jgi:hypothetical protein